MTMAELKANSGDEGLPTGERSLPPGPGSIPKTVSQRLSQYLRILEECLQRGIGTISSQKLADRLELTAAQVRKDFAYFGQFGFPGVGYKVEHLIEQIRRILGTDQGWSVALIGVGRLGTALLRYRGFEKQGFRIEAIFDKNPRRIGRKVEGIKIHNLDDYEEVSRDLGLSMAILAVPVQEAQAVADRLVRAGVLGLLNFAPIRLQLPETVSLVEVDLAVQLEQLSFLVSSQNQQRRSTG